MRKYNTLLALVAILASTALTAQTRYLDAIYGVGEPTEITYGSNISILTGSPAATDLKADVYLPTNDNSTTLRPVVVTWHTGNFLPKIANFSAYGDKDDSIMVNIIHRVVKRGYVGISADYRKGWLPTADDQDTRTGTLLKAVYRASQDAHTLARYLRKTVVEDGNPYQIDTTRIIYIGSGSGGYIAMAHATLDRVEEIARNAQFYDVNGDLLVDENLDSNPFGTTTTPLNMVNHAGYTSDVAMAVNLTGALGDTTWMEGKDNEPMILGYHALADPFAPFHAGTVVVPVTNEPVVDVLGTNLFVKRANELGLNDALADANALQLPDIFPPLASTLNQINSQFKQVRVTSPIPTATMDTFFFSRDNMYPFRSGAVLGAPFNYFDEATLGLFVNGWNAQFPDDPRSVAEIVGGEQMTNPNWDNPAGANLYIDTIMAHFLTRAYIGLDLEDIQTSTNDVVKANAVGFEVFPNPTSAGFTVRTATEFPIRDINIIDINGRTVTSYAEVNQSVYTIERGNLPRGTYLVQLRLDEGVTTRKLVLH